MNPDNMKNEVWSFLEQKAQVYRNFIVIWFYIQILLLPTIGLAAWTSDVSQWHEKQLLELLAEVQAHAEQLVPFTTDGCSGGLSVGWKYLAKNYPSFAKKYGQSPPWEHCCVAHDKVYWKGEVINGYQMRKQADLTLRQCVINHGFANREKYAVQIGKTPQEIENFFNLAADLMYTSIRIGGRPCTVFSWRWGYGWPLCELEWQ